MNARITSPLSPVSSSRSSTTGPSPKFDPYETLHVQADKLPDLWQKFIDSASYTVSHSTVGIEHIILALTVICSVLRHHARQTSYYQKDYHLLLAEALQLASLCELHMQNYGRAMQAATEAERYSLQWKAYDLAAASILRQCQVSRYLGKPRLMYAQYKKLYDIFGHLCSPLIQSHVLIGMAESQALAGVAGREHRSILQMGLSLHPSNPESDPVYPFFMDYQLSTSVARYYVASCELDLALIDLGVSSDQSSVAGCDFFAVDVQSILAEIFVDLEDANNAINSVMALAHKSLALGSQLRYSQSQFMYECLVNASFVRGKSKELAALGKLVVC